MSEKNCVNIKGYCKLYKGDCLKIMKQIPDGKVDMILCDLPYGTTACSWDIIIPFDKLWEQYNRIIKQNGAILLFSNQPFTTDVISSNRQNYRYNWYWIKNTVSGGLLSKKQPMRRLEEICVFYKNSPIYNPVGLHELNKCIVHHAPNGERVYDTKRKKPSEQKYAGYPSNILYFDSKINRLHPTQKPIELLEYLIKTYTKENETVLDNCMGSGSTGVACVNIGRKFVGIEQDEHFYKVACGRIKQQIQYKEDYGEW